MRPSILVCALLLGTTPALAGSNSGNGSGGGGRLGQVSAGVGAAAGQSSGNHSSGGSSSPAPRPTTYGGSERYCDSSSTWSCRHYAAPIETVVLVDPDGTSRVVPATHSRTRFEAYAGAQKVYESDGSVSLELSLVDPNFRVNATLTHYYESQMGGGQLTMTMPELTVGLRFGDVPAWLEGGVVNVQTHGDPMGDTSITGPVVGTRIEHALSGSAMLFGVAEAMYFKNDIKAYGGRVGVKVGHLQASFRVLDFNVGPALYGPEVGLRF